MAKARREKNEGKGGKGGEGLTFKAEVAGIVLLALSLYTAVSLFSYGAGAVANWGGTLGVYLSRAILWAIGYISYVFPLLMLAVSLEFLLRRVFAFRVALPVSFAVFILSSAPLLNIVFLSDTAGGALGGVLSSFFMSWIGATGAMIILSAVLLITILFATGISFIQIGMKLFPPAAGLLKSLATKAMQAGEAAQEEETEEALPTDEEFEDLSIFEEEEAEEIKPAPVVKSRNQGPAIITPKVSKKAADEDEKERLEFSSPKGNFKLPPLSLLDPAPEKTGSIDSDSLLENSKVLEKKLMDFGVEGRVLEVRPGPVVTMYEFEPAPGIKVGRITNLSDDLALAMKAMSIRIIAPIPGKSVVGIEVPNRSKEMITLKEMLEGPAFSKSRSRLSLALGKDISGSPYVADLAKMPHLLVAGATGTGKSVSVNAMILSILFKATPEDVRFLMVDPKMLELSAYEGIPHLMTPVITDPKKAAGALRAIVSEMGKRYKLMAEKGSKNIEKYNQQMDDDGEGEAKRLPYIVVIIDELADLMMTSGKDVEECLVRLSQMARASGIHLMIATQRPSVDVVTGLIKTNFPARIAFQLPSKTDSRTILDAGGAETLLGQGDMLFLPPGTSRLQRIHGAYVSEAEIKKVTEFWKNQGTPAYGDVIMEEEEEAALIDEDADLGEEFLRRYDEAVELASQLEMISTSYIQRRFRIGYNTAARIIEKMEKEGVVGPAQGSRPREVLLRKPHE
ncbi:MAG: DNA translocase FtsK 4TM domain-containing protein [Deltaproteobacteria bacterium]|nr:DNA translocase FtsK 4TM domain-containing protein [Deltaproteobacteria bacterium]